MDVAEVMETHEEEVMKVGVVVAMRIIVEEVPVVMEALAIMVVAADSHSHGQRWSSCYQVLIDHGSTQLTGKKAPASARRRLYRRKASQRGLVLMTWIQQKWEGMYLLFLMSRVTT